MVFKKLNSIKYWTARGKAPMETRKSHRRNDLVKWVKQQLLQATHERKLNKDKAMEKILKEYPIIQEEDLYKFDSDEEPEQEYQQQDMQVYIKNLQGQMENLVGAMKQAETDIVKHNQNPD